MIDAPDRIVLSPAVAEQWRRLAGIRANGYDSRVGEPWPRTPEYLNTAAPPPKNRAQRRARENKGRGDRKLR